AADPHTPQTHPLSLHDALPIFRCALHHVLIGHDVTGWVNDEARAKTLQTLPDFAWLAAVGAEKFRREIFEWIADLPAHYALSIEDRKSTRLNSSHLGISYAVFC